VGNAYTHPTNVLGVVGGLINQKRSLNRFNAYLAGGDTAFTIQRNYLANVKGWDCSTSSYTCTLTETNNYTTYKKTWTLTVDGDSGLAHQTFEILRLTNPF
jgi:hypothetical protein